MNAFEPMYDKEEDVAKGVINLTMKNMFHCLDVVIVSSPNPCDKGINMAVLSSKSPKNRVQLTLRAVWDSQDYRKEGKKALALVQLSEYRDRNLPSGKTYENYLLWLREAMYRHFKGSAKENDDEDDASSTQSTSSAVDGNPDADSASPEMYDSWFFAGYGLCIIGTSLS
jgi:hypothetical protein